MPSDPLSSLREIAEAPDADRWKVRDDDPEWLVVVDDDFDSYSTWTEVCTVSASESLASFIATFDPPTVLALLDVVDAVPSPDKLEWIAKWLDITEDTTLALTIRVARERGYSEEDIAALESARGNEMQNALRALAAALSNLTRLLEESEVASG